MQTNQQELPETVAHSPREGRTSRRLFQGILSRMRDSGKWFVLAGCARLEGRDCMIAEVKKGVGPN